MLALENGKVPAAERSGYVLPKLKAKLAGKRVLAISVYAASPYATLARVIHTGFEAGARELAFKVRKPGTTTDTGWMVLHDEPLHAQRRGRQVSARRRCCPGRSSRREWEESLSACQAGVRGGDCGYARSARPPGGKLDMMLRVRGRAWRCASARPARRRQPRSRKKPKAEMLEGIKGEARRRSRRRGARGARARDRARVHAARRSGRRGAELAGQRHHKPVCGSVSCPAVVDAEGISMSGTVLSLIGAAFPDGTPEPNAGLGAAAALGRRLGVRAGASRAAGRA